MKNRVLSKRGSRKIKRVFEHKKSLALVLGTIMLMTVLLTGCPEEDDTNTTADASADDGVIWVTDIPIVYYVDDVEVIALYTGEWMNDEPNGQGELIFQTGVGDSMRHYTGGFQEGEFHGQSIVTYYDDEVYEIYWDNGEAVSFTFISGPADNDNLQDHTSPPDDFSTAVSMLSVVPFPPPEHVPCSDCNGTRECVCYYCEGTGSTPGADHDVELYSAFGLGGLANTLNNLSCINCNGTGVGACLMGLCDGTMFNSEYRIFALQLRDLADATGHRIFELESNQVSRFLGFNFCGMCDGLGWLPELTLPDGNIALCSMCLAQGVELHFIDSYTEAELTRKYDDFLDRHVATGGAGIPNQSMYTPPSSEYVPSSALRNTIDLGGESTGTCAKPGCGQKTYTAAAFCAWCR